MNKTTLQIYISNKFYRKTTMTRGKLEEDRIDLITRTLSS